MVYYNNSNKENKQTSKKVIRTEGVVIEVLPNTFFKVKLVDGKEILAFLSGKLRIHRIKVLLGDKVAVEMTPYDETKGRIVYRLR